MYHRFSRPRPYDVTIIGTLAELLASPTRPHGVRDLRRHRRSPTGSSSRAGPGRSRNPRRRSSWRSSSRRSCTWARYHPFDVARRSRHRDRVRHQRVPVLHARTRSSRSPTAEARPRTSTSAAGAARPSGRRCRTSSGSRCSTSNRSGSKGRAARPRCGSASRATPTPTCSASSTR